MIGATSFQRACLPMVLPKIFRAPLVVAAPSDHIVNTNLIMRKLYLFRLCACASIDVHLVQVLRAGNASLCRNVIGRSAKKSTVASHRTRGPIDNIHSGFRDPCLSSAMKFPPYVAIAIAHVFGLPAQCQTHHCCVSFQIVLFRASHVCT